MGGARAAGVERQVSALAGRAHVIGVTGPPGSGKSTLVSALTARYRATGRRVGILAVDPSGSSGGAVLGDRLRMGAHFVDDGVFIRSMGSRGRLGGLALACPLAVRVLDAAGYDPVIVETVGVGQLEVDIASHADTVCVVLNPGAGDFAQAMKSGLLECADVFVVNRADRPGVDRLEADLRHRLDPIRSGRRQPVPIVRTVATTSDGVTDLVEVLGRHQADTATSGELASRRLQRRIAEARMASLAELDRRLGEAERRLIRSSDGLQPTGDVQLLVRRLLSMIVEDELGAQSAASGPDDTQ